MEDPNQRERESRESDETRYEEAGEAEREQRREVAAELESEPPLEETEDRN